MRPTLIIGVASVAALAFGGCGGGSGAAATEPAARAASVPTVTVTVKAFTFAPHRLVVRRGTRVTFVNHDQIHHSATAGTRSAPQRPRFDQLLPEATAKSPTRTTIAFREPGTYRYFCRFHPGAAMTGVVVVR